MSLYVYEEVNVCVWCILILRQQVLHEEKKSKIYECPGAPRTVAVVLVVVVLAVVACW